ncbi:ion transporter [bacterium]|nr:ion transporter [bacterium]
MRAVISQFRCIGWSAYAQDWWNLLDIALVASCFVVLYEFTTTNTQDPSDRADTGSQSTFSTAFVFAETHSQQLRAVVLVLSWTKTLKWFKGSRRLFFFVTVILENMETLGGFLAVLVIVLIG